MAKVHICPSGIYAISGTAGDFVYKRYRGETIMGRRPDMSGVELSEAQVANCSHFAQAVEYAKAAKTATIYQETARKKGRCAYHVALSDFRKPPVVKEIDLSSYTGASGDVITIRAYDNVHVAGVTVRLTDEASAVLEAGAAERHYDGCWHYTATASIPSASTVRVEVTASDLPGGTHTAVAEIQVAGVAVEDSCVLQAGPAESEVSGILGVSPEEGEVPESIDRIRRLQSPEVRRARRRGQHRLPSPEVCETREAEPVPSPEFPRDDAPAPVPLENPLVVSPRPARIEDVPESDPVDPLSSIRELLEDRDFGLMVQPGSSMPEREPDHVRLALDLLLRAERLLRTGAEAVASLAEQSNEPLEERPAPSHHDGVRQDAGPVETPFEAGPRPDRAGFGANGPGSSRSARARARQPRVHRQISRPRDLPGGRRRSQTSVFPKARRLGGRMDLTRRPIGRGLTREIALHLRGVRRRAGGDARPERRRYRPPVMPSDVVSM